MTLQGQNHEAMIFRSARILDPASEIDLECGDLEIRNGKIVRIESAGTISSTPGVREIDCSGLWLTPGFIDVHVHLREPGQEHKETISTGTRAAVAGGFTSVACMANTQPVNDSAAVTGFIRAKATETAHCRVFPIGAVSKGLKGETLADLGSMIAEGAVALSDDGMPVMNSKLMRHAMEYASAFGVPVISHAEDAHLSHGTCMNEGAHSFSLGLPGNPDASEEIMVAREVALCRLTGARVHIAHLSTKLALAHVRRAKEEGLPITAEVTPHHLVLDDGALLGYSTHCKMAPPLRSRDDVEAMIEGLEHGWIDMIATDHAPHSREEKSDTFAQAPNGIIGLQTVIPVTLEWVRRGKLSLARWLTALTSAPAKLLNLPTGKIKIEAAADLCLIDPGIRWRLEQNSNHSQSENSPWLNHELIGKAVGTWVDGKRMHFDSSMEARLR